MSLNNLTFSKVTGVSVECNICMYYVMSMIITSFVVEFVIRASCEEHGFPGKTFCQR